MCTPSTMLLVRCSIDTVTGASKAGCLTILPIVASMRELKIDQISKFVAKHLVRFSTVYYVLDNVLIEREERILNLVCGSIPLNGEMFPIVSSIESLMFLRRMSSTEDFVLDWISDSISFVSIVMEESLFSWTCYGPDFCYFQQALHGG